MRQFICLSWGGVVGYTVTGGLALLVWANGWLGSGSWFAAGAATGGAAFIVQSWAVDLPQIVRVSRGADAADTNKAGTQPDIILRRTWQTWVPLAVLIWVGNF